MSHVPSLHLYPHCSCCSLQITLAHHSLQQPGVQGAASFPWRGGKDLFDQTLPSRAVNQSPGNASSTRAAPAPPAKSPDNIQQDKAVRRICLMRILQHRAGSKVSHHNKISLSCLCTLHSTLHTWKAPNAPPLARKGALGAQEKPFLQEAAPKSMHAFLRRVNRKMLSSG